ncbi:hypothetical protein [Sphingomonas sp. CROZ-RG-20F-R02-07]|uniref:hypothetical protein n=1 Tax=Sphingomonas sp. CROZ-RG-20F-R02-07 TaxID=2914832 RepID=UPI001F581F88|nr:hypothetical protein [Sphingomonas sp. CROZ-RG-20F-R02-07]
MPPICDALHVAGEGCDEAEVLAIMSSLDEELMRELLTLHEGRKGVPAAKPAGRRRAPLAALSSAAR